MGLGFDLMGLLDLMYCFAAAGPCTAPRKAPKKATKVVPNEHAAAQVAVAGAKTKPMPAIKQPTANAENRASEPAFQSWMRHWFDLLLSKPQIISKNQSKGPLLT